MKDILKQKNIQNLMRSGIAYEENDKFQEAIKEYREVIKLKEDYTEAYNRIGIIYEKQGKIKDALAEFSNGIKTNNDYPEIHFNLALLYKNQLFLSDSQLNLLKSKLDILPEDLLEKALNEFKNVIRLDSHNE